MELRIKRIDRDDTTIYGVGTFTTEDTNFSFQTIERKGMQIEEGAYNCSYTHSPRFNTKLYYVEVPNRQGIRLHVANWGHELEGCIGLAEYRKGNMIKNSRKTVETFHRLSEGKNLKLIIKNEENFRKTLTKVFGQIIGSTCERIRKINESRP